MSGFFFAIGGLYLGLAFGAGHSRNRLCPVEYIAVFAVVGALGLVGGWVAR